MEALLSKIKGLRVVVIGDIMLDHYVWGDSTRISPEAPVPVIDVSKDTYVPGGAANVALNVSAMGAKAVLCGSMANDDAGGQLMAMLHQSGISLDSRFSRCEAPTILKTRVVVRNQQLCRVDRESAPSEYEITDGELLSLIEDKLKYADAIILSDYNKGVITESLVRKVRELTAGREILIAMDPKPRAKLRFEGVDILTPNRAEALALAGIELDMHEKFPAQEVCKILWERFKAPYLVVTMGAEGMLLCENGGNVRFMPTVAKEVYDVSGAGDTVVCAITSALVSGASLDEAARFANVAAGVVVSKLGTATATPEEILAYMLSGDEALV